MVTCHILLLVYCDPYLYVHRKAFLPLRRLIMPLVIAVAKSESMEEKSDTWYQSTADARGGDSTPSAATSSSTAANHHLPISTEMNSKILLESFSKKVRRDIKRKLKKYKQRGITTKTKHSDYLSLRRDMPVLIDHERKAIRGTDKSLKEEFIKRFLVIFLSSDGYIDRYYAPPAGGSTTYDDDDQPVALSLFVGQGDVLHCFMYFCVESESASGIWFYHHTRMMLRMASQWSQKSKSISNHTERSLLNKDRLHVKPCYRHVNFHVHQDYTKKMIGLIPAPCDDNHFLYPFQCFHKPPTEMANAKLDMSEIF